MAELDSAGEGPVRIQALEMPELPDDPAQSPRCYSVVEELVVAQANRRGGTATRLMNGSHRRALDLAVTEIGLTVFDFNLPAFQP